jgi:hypothetical protein
MDKLMRSGISLVLPQVLAIVAPLQEGCDQGGILDNRP